MLSVSDPKTGFSLVLMESYLSQDTNQMENFPVPGGNFFIHNKLILIGFFVKITYNLQHFRQTAKAYLRNIQLILQVCKKICKFSAVFLLHIRHVSSLGIIGRELEFNLRRNCISTKFE